MRRAFGLWRLSYENWKKSRWTLKNLLLVLKRRRRKIHIYGMQNILNLSHHHKSLVPFSKRYKRNEHKKNEWKMKEKKITRLAFSFCLIKRHEHTLTHLILSPRHKLIYFRLISTFSFANEKPKENRIWLWLSVTYQIFLTLLLAAERLPVKKATIRCQTKQKRKKIPTSSPNIPSLYFWRYAIDEWS